jgi:hypothetical protein
MLTLHPFDIEFSRFSSDGSSGLVKISVCPERISHVIVEFVAEKPLKMLFRRK